MKPAIDYIKKLYSIHKSIHLFYWNENFEGKYNIGDLFSLLIVRALSSYKVNYTLPNTPFPFKLGAIGSIINDSILKTGGIFWGSGMLVSKLSKHFTPAVFTAVRGPLTRQSLLEAGYKCPDIYGDPALLLPKHYQPIQKSKKYKIGIICHWRHIDLIQCEGDVKFIDILRTEENAWSFIDEICECEMILSSSLHGIIIANAYNIPAKQMIFEGYPLEGDPLKKFHDYYMSVNMPIQQPLCLKKGTKITNNTKIEYDSIVDLNIDLKKLQESFPF